MASIIPMPYLNQASQQTYNAMAGEARKASAYNALRAAYGDMAGDPQAALQLQQYGFNEQMNPLQIENQQLTNTGLDQQNNYLSQAYPKQLENQDLVNTGQGVTNALNAQQFTSNDMAIKQAQAKQAHAALSASIDNLGTSLNGISDPQARGAAFDQEVQRLAPLLGADPNQLAQQLAPQRAAIVNQGVDALPGIQSDLSGLMYGAMTPEDMAKLQQSKAQLALTNAQTNKALIDAQGAQTKMVNDAQGALADTKAEGQALGFMQDRVRYVGTDLKDDNGNVVRKSLITQAKELLAQSSDNEYQRKFNAWARPDSPEWKLQQVLNQINHNLSLDDLRNMKEAGVSFGRVTNVEFLASGQAIANTEIGQSKEKLLADLNNASETYKQMNDAMTERVTNLQKDTERLQAQADAASNVPQIIGPSGPQVNSTPRQGPQFQLQPNSSGQVVTGPTNNQTPDQTQQTVQPPPQTDVTFNGPPSGTVQAVQSAAPGQQTAPSTPPIPWNQVEANLPALADKYGI